MQTYINMLAALPTLPERLRSSINHNLDQILQLHEEILGELHRAVPHSEYSQADHPAISSKSTSRKIGHRRLPSLDTLPKDPTGLQWLEMEPGMFSEPQVAAEAAKIFSKRMHRFFVYKEYGAKYEIMINDATSALENLPEWEIHQKGLEAFAFTMESSPSGGGSRKSLTIGDLLVKPIQRICKYPLLFAELLRCTPVFDCPNSHMEVETALMRLREATSEINRSAEDNLMKGALEKTWLLQDRIVFPNRVRFALFIITWTDRSSETRCKFEESAHGLICTLSGLQCHLAPFSWKLVFESDHQLYELVMTACTPKEESEWRSRLSRPRALELDVKAPSLQVFLSLDIQSLGTVFGRPGTIARSLSTHQTSVGGPESPLCHVILKNTTAIRPSISIGSGLNRSQSLLSTRVRTPVLVSSRGERARLEVLLADVWSQDVLPLPSMTNIARNEQIIRRSASMMMRKLSVSSVARRSGSVTRRVTEDPSSDDQTPQTSLSSDSGFDIFDRIGREESSQSYTTKSSILPDAREFSEEDCIPVTKSPILELTQISELEPLGLLEIFSDKHSGSETGKVTAVKKSTTGQLQTGSCQDLRRTETDATAKKSLPSCTDVQGKDDHLAKGRSFRGKRKHTGIRRFFR
ncbi:hypothetical protein KAF25_001814 [Fusarium avenaceum]|uniref:DH domain-containing protein n=1 Tax=Fusarium avenaceum TaxID=40199 RepID=A0A9P7KQL0_9HYPO|nr:hypothetical protein KAF25_001814 [Fusarium avenaceum]